MFISNKNRAIHQALSLFTECKSLIHDHHHLVFVDVSSSMFFSLSISSRGCLSDKVSWLVHQRMCDRFLSGGVLFTRLVVNHVWTVRLIHYQVSIDNNSFIIILRERFDDGIWNSGCSKQIFSDFTNETTMDSIRRKRSRDKETRKEKIFVYNY